MIDAVNHTITRLGVAALDCIYYRLEKKTVHRPSFYKVFESPPWEHFLARRVRFFAIPSTTTVRCFQVLQA